MHSTTKLKLEDLNPHLLCVLCGGYLIDATTIIECIHSFCRTCIYKYLESSKYCPICDVQVHKTKPLLNVRSDKTLQTLVYKMVPALFKDEMRRRREFYAAHPEQGIKSECSPNVSELRGDVKDVDDAHSKTEDEKISVCLHHCVKLPPYHNEHWCASKNQDNRIVDKRHLLCPSSVTVGHLKKLIRLKCDLPPEYRIDIFYSDEGLRDTYTLLDIAHIYAWRRLEPLKLHYIVHNNTFSQLQLSPPSVASMRRPKSDCESITKRDLALDIDMTSDDVFPVEEHVDTAEIDDDGNLSDSTTIYNVNGDATDTKQEMPQQNHEGGMPVNDHRDVIKDGGDRQNNCDVERIHPAPENAEKDTQSSVVIEVVDADTDTTSVIHVDGVNADVALPEHSADSESSICLNKESDQVSVSNVDIPSSPASQERENSPSCFTGEAQVNVEKKICSQNVTSKTGPNDNTINSKERNNNIKTNRQPTIPLQHNESISCRNSDSAPSVFTQSTKISSNQRETAGWILPKHIQRKSTVQNCISRNNVQTMNGQRSSPFFLLGPQNTLYPLQQNYTQGGVPLIPYNNTNGVQSLASLQYQQLPASSMAGCLNGNVVSNPLSVLSHGALQNGLNHSNGIVPIANTALQNGFGRTMVCGGTGPGHTVDPDKAGIVPSDNGDASTKLYKRNQIDKSLPKPEQLEGGDCLKSRRCVEEAPPSLKRRHSDDALVSVKKSMNSLDQLYAMSANIGEGDAKESNEIDDANVAKRTNGVHVTSNG